MPIIKKANEISKKGYDYYLLQPCKDCGRYRWVKIVKGEPQSIRCNSCAAKVRARVRGSYKGGQIKRRGYIFIFSPSHPNSQKNGYIKRSRLVMEKIIGGSLPEGMVVHHINGIRTDDRPENLKLLTNSEHTALHNSNS